MYVTDGGHGGPPAAGITITSMSPFHRKRGPVHTRSAPVLTAAASDNMVVHSLNIVDNSPHHASRPPQLYKGTVLSRSSSAATLAHHPQHTGQATTWVDVSPFNAAAPHNSSGVADSGAHLAGQASALLQQIIAATVSNQQHRQRAKQRKLRQQAKTQPHAAKQQQQQRSAAASSSTTTTTTTTHQQQQQHRRVRLDSGERPPYPKVHIIKTGGSRRRNQRPQTQHGATARPFSRGTTTDFGSASTSNVLGLPRAPSMPWSVASSKHGGGDAVAVEEGGAQQTGNDDEHAAAPVSSRDLVNLQTEFSTMLTALRPSPSRLLSTRSLQPQQLHAMASEASVYQLETCLTPRARSAALIARKAAAAQRHQGRQSSRLLMPAASNYSLDSSVSWADPHPAHDNPIIAAAAERQSPLSVLSPPLIIASPTLSTRDLHGAGSTSPTHAVVPSSAMRSSPESLTPSGWASPPRLMAEHHYGYTHHGQPAQAVEEQQPHSPPLVLRQRESTAVRRLREKLQPREVRGASPSGRHLPSRKAKGHVATFQQLTAYKWRTRSRGSHDDEGTRQQAQPKDEAAKEPHHVASAASSPTANPHVTTLLQPTVRRVGRLTCAGSHDSPIARGPQQALPQLPEAAEVSGAQVPATDPGADQAAVVGDKTTSQEYADLAVGGQQPYQVPQPVAAAAASEGVHRAPQSEGTHHRKPQRDRRHDQQQLRRGKVAATRSSRTQAPPHKLHVVDVNLPAGGRRSGGNGGGALWSPLTTKKQPQHDHRPSEQQPLGTQAGLQGAATTTTTSTADSDRFKWEKSAKCSSGRSVHYAYTITDPRNRILGHGRNSASTLSSPSALSPPRGEARGNGRSKSHSTTAGKSYASLHSWALSDTPSQQLQPLQSQSQSQSRRGSTTTATSSAPPTGRIGSAARHLKQAKKKNQQQQQQQQEARQGAVRRTPRLRRGPRDVPPVALGGSPRRQSTDVLPPSSRKKSHDAAARLTNRARNNSGEGRAGPQLPSSRGGGGGAVGNTANVESWAGGDLPNSARVGLLAAR